MSQRNPDWPEGLDTFLDLEVAALVPEAYAHWRPLVAGGLRYFLAALPEERLETLFVDQLALPAEASPAERLVALLRHSPTLHKLGQVVARDRRLAPELRQRLQALESLPASTPMPDLRRILRRELGNALDSLIVAPQALAEGSVAVAVPFSWPGGEGVFKILKPGIAARLEEDLAIWVRLAEYLEVESAQLGLPPLDYREILASVGRLLQSEVDLAGEQAHMAAAQQTVPAGVVVPALLPWCTPRLTAMTRVHGQPITEVDGLDPAERRRLATALVHGLLAQPFLDPAAEAPFHADPHAGNLFRTTDGQVALLDWALVVRVPRPQREALLRLILAALAQDAAGVAEAIAAMALQAPDPATLRAIVATALGQVRHGRFPGLGWSLDLLDRIATQGTLRFPEELLLLRKALLTLQGVLADLDPACPTDTLLLGWGLARFVSELPARALSPLDARAFGCPLSLADLYTWTLSTPAAALRYWTGQWQDWGRHFAVRPAAAPPAAAD